MKRFIVILILFLILFIVLFNVSTSNKTPTPNIQKYTQIDSYQINYIDHGSGLTLIFIHGFGASNYCWRKNIEPLSKHYRVCAPDLLGFGYSDKPRDADYSLDSYADFIIKFMDKLKIREAILVGHSLGGGIALLACLKFPARVKGLVLIDAEAYAISPPMMLSISQWPVLKAFIHKAINKWVIRISLERSYYNKNLITATLVDHYYDPFLTDNGKYVPIKVLQTMDFKKLKSLPKQYRHINKKTLIIWGKEDQISKIHLAHRLKKDIRNSKLVIIPESGHLVQEEKALLVNDAIVKFVKRSWKKINISNTKN